MAKRLAYDDRYKRVQDALMDIPSLDGLVPFPTIDELENHVRYIWTAEEWMKLISVVKTGADLIYPEEAQNILWSILRGMHLPQTFTEEQSDCYNYPVYAPFNSFLPYNPYQDPDFVPAGYLVPPFLIGGGVGYLPDDLIVRFDSFPLLANWWDLINGNLPTMIIKTVGDGQIELDLLNIVQGGYVVLKNNSPPNILDIILGIFDPNIRIVDTQIDIAFPTELDLVVSEEWDLVVGAGIENNLYVTFIPAIDDIWPPFGLPLRFGGGVRQVGLCGFESAGVIMGMTDLRLFQNAVEAFEDGQWVEKFNLAIWHMQYGNNNASRITSNDVDILALQVQDTVHTSTLLDLSDQIDSHETRLDNHDVDILALQNADIALQGQIDTNDTDITNLQNADVTMQAEIDQNTGDIAAHDITINQHSIAIIEHNDRLLALEGADDYAGTNTNALHTAWEADYASQTQFSTTAGVWFTLVDLDKEIVLQEANVYVELTYYIQAKIQQGEDVQFRVTDGTNFVVMAQTQGLSGNIWDSSRLTGYFIGLDAGATTFQLQWTHFAGGELRLRGLQKAQALEVYNAEAIPFEFGGLITFDAGGNSGYELGTTDAAKLIASVVGSGGNPDGAMEVEFLQGSTWFNEMAYIDIDMRGLRTITNILWDEWTDIGNDKSTQFLVYADTVELLRELGLNHIQGAWVSWDTLVDISDIFPFDASIVRLGFSQVSGPIPVPSLMRFDNILIVVE